MGDKRLQRDTQSSQYCALMPRTPLQHWLCESSIRCRKTEAPQATSRGAWGSEKVPSSVSDNRERESPALNVHGCRPSKTYACAIQSRKPKKGVMVCTIKVGPQANVCRRLAIQENRYHRVAMYVDLPKRCSCRDWRDTYPISPGDALS